MTNTVERSLIFVSGIVVNQVSAFIVGMSVLQGISWWSLLLGVLCSSINGAEIDTLAPYCEWGGLVVLVSVYIACYLFNCGRACSITVSAVLAVGPILFGIVKGIYPHG